MVKVKDEDYIISVRKDCDGALNICLSELTSDWHHLQTDLRNRFAPQRGVIFSFSWKNDVHLAGKVRIS